MNPFQKLGVAIAATAGAAIVLWSADVRGWLDPTTAAWAQAVGTVAAIGGGVWAALRQIEHAGARERRDRAEAIHARLAQDRADRAAAIGLVDGIVRGMKAVLEQIDELGPRADYSAGATLFSIQVDGLARYPTELLRDASAASFFSVVLQSSKICQAGVEHVVETVKQGADPADDIRALKTAFEQLKQVAALFSGRCNELDLTA